MPTTHHAGTHHAVTQHQAWRGVTRDSFVHQASSTPTCCCTTPQHCHQITEQTQPAHIRWLWCCQADTPCRRQHHERSSSCVSGDGSLASTGSTRAASRAASTNQTVNRQGLSGRTGACVGGVCVCATHLIQRSGIGGNGGGASFRELWLLGLDA